MQVKVDGHSLIGQKINEWTVLDVVNTDKLLCQCSCGKIKEVYKSHLIHDKSFSCGCIRRGYDKDPMIGKKFGEWTVIKKTRNARKYLCKCSCGTVKEQYKSNLERLVTTSCGCKKSEKRRETFLERFGDDAPARIHRPRSKEQIDIASSEAKMKDYISKLDERDKNLVHIANELDLSMSHMYILVKKFNLQDILNYTSTASQSELELRSFIESIYNGKIEYNTRSVIPPQEIDIYIPELKTGIEFNGNYWHSEINKERNYHQEKTIKAAKAGVRLIHIFEYEWVNNNRAIKTFIKQLFDKNKQVVYARNTKVIDIDKYTEKEFENKYHLQGYSKSNTAIGLTYNNELIGIMTFGKSRFNEKSTEVIRLCYKDTVAVVGGTEKLISAYINKTNDTNIISYCDISKFTGNSYSRVGFKVDRITEPNYVWTNSNSEVLTRYQTQKNKLVSKGLGVESETEADIMYRLGYYRVYNSGNIKLMYNKK